jgi:cystathionine beta-lyase/cystathionine gamma-synthase
VVRCDNRITGGPVRASIGSEDGEDLVAAFNREFAQV